MSYLLQLQCTHSYHNLMQYKHTLLHYWQSHLSEKICTATTAGRNLHCHNLKQQDHAFIILTDTIYHLKPPTERYKKHLGKKRILVELCKCGLFN
jgi:hypothetical protein